MTSNNTRTKKVFTTRELPHIWANQNQDEGRAGSFYFKGATIFSYGSHFPIATIEGNDVLFTLRSYSNTTAKHISKSRQAISHKNIIYCYDVPVNSYGSDKPLNKMSFITEHENNLKRWKDAIKSLFAELGNKKIRNTEYRINEINLHISRLNTYCQYFKIPLKDKELKDLIKLSQTDNFVNAAIEAKDKQNAAIARKMKAATKAHDQYIDLWREYKDEEIKELSPAIKELINYYSNHSEAYTRLRYNSAHNRLETSKGIEIPAAIAKKAFIQLNGCMEGACKDIAVPVLHYTITETTKDYIKAGCHTIPKSDVEYIATLLKWRN